MEKDKITKSNQDQAIAAWVDYLNQIRLDNLIEALKKQDINLKNALEIINQAITTIHDDIIATNRGGDDGSHGFIAEIAQWGIENAKQRIDGHDDSIEWVNDNGPTDLIRTVIRNGKVIKENIQQKFYHSGDGLSLDAIEKHFTKYPDYLKNNGKYQIPREQYEKIIYYANITEEQANRMPTSDGTFSLKQWRRVQDFVNNSKIDIDNVEPSDLSYKEVQKGKIDETMESSKEDIKQRDQVNRDKLYNDSKPSLKEGVKVTVVSTLAECASSFVSELTSKVKLKKGIRNLDAEDWKDVAAKSGYGAVKGGVRGISVYTLSNYTATPAYMATAMVTSAFGIGEEIYKFNKGEIDEVTMIEQAELLSLDAVMSAVTSLLGQYVIPVPILGAIIGNTVGMFTYSKMKNSYFEKQAALFEGYINELEEQKSWLDEEYKKLYEEIQVLISEFMSICEMAFSVDINEAFEGSIMLAKKMGVSDREILDSKEKIASYFMD